MSKTRVVSKINKGGKARTRKNRGKRGGDEENSESGSYIVGGGLLLLIGLGIMGFSGSSSSHKTAL